MQALYSELIADESVNCDEAECVGRSIQDSLDGVSLKATVKGSAQATTLSSVKPSVKIRNEEMVIDAMVLFSRLVVLLQRHDDITRLFACEVSVAPMSLFKDNMMRKLSKSALGKAIEQRQTKDASKPDGSFSMESENEFGEGKEENGSDVEDNIFEIFEDTRTYEKDTTSDTSHINYAVDGGYLLHRVVWDKVSTYKEIIHLYQKYVHALYEKYTIVFNEYVPVPSTKDHKHKKRLMKSIIAPDMSVELKNTFTA